ncbi:MAG: ribonuclease Z [Bacteroidales bacterium]|nr:ribonuclease Z [Bacteroidales bacterium]
MEFSFLTMGTASALPTANRYPSAHILTVRERLFLIDCGEGAQMQMRKFGISFAKIDDIFISHLHGDHLFGLFGLLSTMAMSGRTGDLRIYAPGGFEKILSFFMEQFGEGIKYNIIFNPIKCKEPVQIYDSRQLEVFAFPLVHRGETYGFLFKEKAPQLNVHKHLIGPYKLSLYEIARLKEGSDVVRKATFKDDDGSEVEYEETLKNEEFTYLPYKPRSFAYCTDTLPFKRLAGWIKGADMVYHDSTYTKEYEELAKTTFHSTSSAAACCAKEAGARKLVLGHYSSRYKSLETMLEEAKEVFPATELAMEGMKFEIELDKYKE